MRPRSKTTKQPLAEPLPPFSQKRASKRDLACLYGVSLRTVDTWISQKKIPYIKLGKIVRFNVDQVEAALARYTVREVS